MSIVAESERLALYQFSSRDIDGFYHLNHDPVVLQYTGDKAFQNKQEVEAFIQAYSHYQEHGFGRWSVYLKADNRYLGFCGLRFSTESQEVDIGYRIVREYWGQGIATEAASIALELGFKQFNIASIVGRAMQANRASFAVLKKLSFKFEKDFSEQGIMWSQYRLCQNRFLNQSGSA